MLKSLLLAIGLAASSAAQTPSLPPVVFNDFSGGLNTEKASLLIGVNESPDLQNVVLDKRGAITKRQGSRRINTSAIGAGVADVNAVYQLEKSDGTRYCVAFSSASGYYSTDACVSFTVFVTTLTSNSDVHCDALQDRLYCVNGTYNFFFNGTDDVPVTAIPAGTKYIRVHRNRCFFLGASANPSRLSYSALGDCTTVAAADFIDVAPEDGDVGTAIGPPLYDMLPIGKKFSYWVLKGNTPLTWTLNNISKTTGVKNHRSIDNFNNVQIFDSVGPHGGRPGLYAFNGIVISEASKKLRNEIENLSSFATTQGLRTVDAKSDWDLGTFDSRALSSSRDVGFMQSSYTAISETSAADFSAGTLASVSTADVDGSVTLSSYTFGDSFGDGNYTSNPTWTPTGSDDVQRVNSVCWVNNDLDTSGSETGVFTMVTPVASSTGSWTIGLQHKIASAVNSVNLYSRYHFMSDTNSQTTSDGYLLRAEVNSSGNRIYHLYRSDSGSEVVLASETASGYTVGDVQSSTVTIVRNESGRFVVSGLPVSLSEVTDTTYSSSTYNLFRVSFQALSGAVHQVCISTVSHYRYETSGSYTSKIYDTAISTPIWNTFEAVVSSPTSETALTFEVQSSTAGDGGGFESLQSQSLGAEAVAAQRRYFRMKGSFTSTNSTSTPSMANWSTAAASTGVWTSQEMLLSENMTTWGLFQTVETTSGEEAAISYCIKTSTTLGQASLASCVAITPGSAITASTGAYVIVIATFTVGVGSETARTDLFTLNWNEGSNARSATGKVFGGHYHYCGQSQSGSFNDLCYVLDDNGAWVRWTGIRARHLNVVNQQFVVGDSTTSSGGFVHRLYVGDSDSAPDTNIDAYWTSKDLALTQRLENVKAIDRLFTVHAATATTLTASLLADTGLRSKSYSLNLSTGAAFGIASSVVRPALNGNSFRVKFANNGVVPFDVLGFILYIRDLGLKQP